MVIIRRDMFEHKFFDYAQKQKFIYILMKEWEKECSVSHFRNSLSIPLFMYIWKF